MGRIIPSASVQKSDDEHVWSFKDARVTQLLIDPSSFRFQVWTLDAFLEVRVGVDFELSSGSEAMRLRIEEPVTLAPALSLLGVELKNLIARREGTLELVFRDGRQLSVKPHPHYEAWEVHGNGFETDIGYLCGPGGGSPWG